MSCPQNPTMIESVLLAMMMGYCWKFVGCSTIMIHNVPYITTFLENTDQEEKTNSQQLGIGEKWK